MQVDRSEIDPRFERDLDVLFIEQGVGPDMPNHEITHESAMRYTYDVAAALDLIRNDEGQQEFVDERLTSLKWTDKAATKIPYFIDYYVWRYGLRQGQREAYVKERKDPYEEEDWEKLARSKTFVFDTFSDMVRACAADGELEFPMRETLTVEGLLEFTYDVSDRLDLNGDLNKRISTRDDFVKVRGAEMRFRKLNKDISPQANFVKVRAEELGQDYANPLAPHNAHLDTTQLVWKALKGSQRKAFAVRYTKKRGMKRVREEEPIPDSVQVILNAFPVADKTKVINEAVVIYNEDTEKAYSLFCFWMSTYFHRNLPFSAKATSIIGQFQEVGATGILNAQIVYDKLIEEIAEQCAASFDSFFNNVQGEEVYSGKRIADAGTCFGVYPSSALATRENAIIYMGFESASQEFVCNSSNEDLIRSIRSLNLEIYLLREEPFNSLDLRRYFEAAMMVILTQITPTAFVAGSCTNVLSPDSDVFMAGAETNLLAYRLRDVDVKIAGNYLDFVNGVKK